MSTFDGFVNEFPNIRIDYFRTQPGRPPPLACFLSHVHSDHLQGLESLKSPFVYCSPTTRQLLLRLEKYPHRMNFSKGILECRKQTYKHLKTLLKPIPLETPTRIELSPGKDVQVTLFDANHCAGAVMFLIEGQGKAILYTGDTRSEQWWVDVMARQPMLLPYTTPFKHLDCIYLDTTFAVKSDPYRHFPSKASGLRELLGKLAPYPPTTLFYFQAWTFGYEDVWLALSQALESLVHLDRYRHALYTSLSHTTGPGLECRESPTLCGFKCGNTHNPGILTPSPATRLHSCEKGTGCPAMTDPATPIVTITPIISRHAGVELRELGAGGGQGDLDQIHELDLSDPLAVGHLLTLCATNIEDPALLGQIKDMLMTSRMADKGGLQLGLPDDLDDDALLDSGEIPLDRLPKLIAELALSARRDPVDVVSKPADTGKALPKNITFPYSRHSSYEELRLLVGAFRPRSVWPCTVPPEHAWSEEMSMCALFGDLCDVGAEGFVFDVEMRARVEEGRRRKRGRLTQGGEDDGEGEEDVVRIDAGGDGGLAGASVRSPSPVVSVRGGSETNSEPSPTTEKEVPESSPPLTQAPPLAKERTQSVVEISPLTSRQRLRARQEAFDAARQGRWHEIGLSCVKRARLEGWDEEL